MSAEFTTEFADEKHWHHSGRHRRLGVPAVARHILPQGAASQAEELAHASRHVTAIEINGTFYHSGKPDSFRKWRDETPGGFVFSVKGPRVS